MRYDPLPLIIEKVKVEIFARACGNQTDLYGNEMVPKPATAMCKDGFLDLWLGNNISSYTIAC